MIMFRSISRITLILLIALSCQWAFSATYDVTDYGAVGTGNEAHASTNVTAITNAIAAAGVGDTVHIPAGIYYLNDRIKPNKDRLIIDGYDATLKRVSSAHPNGYMSLIEIGTSTGIVIQGLTIDGNRTEEVSSVSFGIRNDYGWNLTIKDCTVTNCESDGIAITNQKAETTIDNCDIIANHRQGIGITDSAGFCVITNCYFEGNDGSGIDIEPNWRHTAGHAVQNCTFDGSGGLVQLFGHGTSYVWDVLIDDCDFVNGAELRCNKSMEITATNNTFTGGGAVTFNDPSSGYRGAGQITLTGNTFDGNPMSPGSNLLANAGFESWSGATPDNWTVGGAGPVVLAKTSWSPLEGSCAASVDADGTFDLSQTVSATAGAYYTFGGYVSCLLKESGNKPYIIVEFLDAGSGVIKAVNPMLAYYELHTYGLYEKVMGITKAPAGAVSARIRVGRLDVAGGYVARFDGMFFVEGIGNEDLTASKDKVLRFDFGPMPGNEGFYPHADHIGIDPNTMYGYDGDTGLTYGLFNNHSTDDITGSFKGNSGGWTRTVSSDLGLTYITLPKEGGGAVAGFEVELPNGLYYVTVGAGNVGWDSWVRMNVEGNIYVAVSDPNENENLYILDIAPEPAGSGGPMGWDLSMDLSKHRAPDSAGAVQTWGANNQHPGYYEYAELLYLKDQIVEVADGRLTVYGGDMRVGHFNLNFLEVAPLGISDCASVWAAGLAPASDINRDCYVNILDLAAMAANWLASSSL